MKKLLKDKKINYLNKLVKTKNRPRGLFFLYII